MAYQQKPFSHAREIARHLRQRGHFRATPSSPPQFIEFMRWIAKPSGLGRSFRRRR